MSQIQSQYIDARVQEHVAIITVRAAELRGEALTECVLDELRAALEQSGCLQVVLDLREVHFLSSLGIQLLLSFRRLVRQRGGQLLLCCLDPFVADVLLTSRLTTASQSGSIPFGIAPDIETAVGALNSGTSDK